MSKFYPQDIQHLSGGGFSFKKMVTPASIGGFIGPLSICISFPWPSICFLLHAVQ